MAEAQRRQPCAGEHAWHEMYDQYAGLVFGVVLHEVSHRADAEDITQQVFLKAWRSRGRFDPNRGEMRAWVLSITRSAIADHRSARARDRAVRAAVTTEPPATGVRTAAHTAPADAVASGLVVARALDRLAAAQRVVVALVILEDLTHRQVAERTGWPLGTVKSHWNRALNRLRADDFSPVGGAPQPGPTGTGKNRQKVRRDRIHGVARSGTGL